MDPTTILAILSFARSLLAWAKAGGETYNERVKPVLEEGDRRLDAMVAEQRGPNEDDQKWIADKRHGYVDEIQKAADEAPPGS